MFAKLVIAATLATAGMSAVAAADDAPAGQPEEFHGRSSFWGNDRPAVNGAYRYRLLGIGVVLAGLSGLGMLRLVRRANDERAMRATQAEKAGKLGA
jgi:hypothetical protein